MLTEFSLKQKLIDSMRKPLIALGIFVGLTISILIFSKLFEYFLGGCFFEQGCEPYEDLKVILILATSISVGIFSGYLSMLVLEKIFPR